MSDETQKVVDEEIFRIVDEGYKLAHKLLKKHIKDLHIISEGLLEYETLSGDEIKALLKGIKPVREGDEDEGGTPTPSATGVPTSVKKKATKPKKDSGGMKPQPQS